MTRKSPKRRATVESVAATLRTVDARVYVVVDQVREFRVQQAQTETHLANMTQAIVGAGLQSGRDTTSVLERMARLEAIVAQIAEGFAIVQNDIAQIQKFVGRQTELLAEIKAATVAVPTTGPELVARVEEARRQTRQTVTVRGEERQASEFDPPGDRRARATDV